MKTPEEMAEEFSNWFVGERRKTIAKKSWYTGFEEGLKAAKDQFADADKVMNSPKKLDSWISVKERLPNVEKTSRALRRESTCVLIVSYGNVFVAHLCEDWSDRSHFIFEACNCNCRAFDMEIDEWKLDQVTHWMPLPEAPKEEK